RRRGRPRMAMSLRHRRGQCLGRDVAVQQRSGRGLSVASAKKGKVRVGIVMGSDADLAVMEEADRGLDEVGVGNEFEVRSAHGTPDAAAEYAGAARARVLEVIIAGAGGAAHLAGAMAAHSKLPVLGVPLATSPLLGFDALLAAVQMPPGVPV